MIIIYIILCIVYGMGISASFLGNVFGSPNEGLASMMTKAIFWPIRVLMPLLKKVFRL